MDEADRILNMDFEQEVMIYVSIKWCLDYFVDEGHLLVGVRLLVQGMM